ncbi:MAG TPA: YihY/virulence factor BrkB family protein [Cytophagaceae bacterium]
MNLIAKAKEAGSLLKRTYIEWMEDEPFDLSSSVAYYAIFSLPALLIIIISIAGIAFGREAVQGQISSQIGGMIGPQAGKDIQEMIANAYKSDTSVISSIIGVATLLFGATGVFLQVQKSLNRVWDVKVDPNAGIKKLVLDRATSLGIIVAIGFMMLISLVVTTGLSALSDWIQNRLPDFILYIFYVVNFLVSLGIVTMLFAIIFKVLPDVKLKWHHVWIGAGVTAVLFEIGRFALGLYFGKSEPASAYGAAGTVILMMLWVFYSCLILFFGAQFTQVYAKRKDKSLRPSEHAVQVKIVEHTEPNGVLKS